MAKKKALLGPSYVADSRFIGGRPIIRDKNGYTYVLGDRKMRQPREINAGGGSEWQEVKRSGLKPLMRYGNRKLRTLSWKVTVGAANLQTSCETQAKWFRTRAEAGTQIRFSGSGSPALEEGLWWIISEWSIDVTARNKKGEVSRADITLTLTEASDIPTVKAKAKKKKKKGKKKKAKKKKKGKKKRYHKIKKGDTLWDLARKYYKDPYKWKRIASANRPIKPRRLRIGRKIVIP
ncbi:LysM peptidoglycan-binding domain-containing protein [Brevibacterium moorei]|uniref:LysM peptidoglycan-binding domain-containing protein n=1 Tax=Brevibacterium moorei TaxID=2968457 RepID=UPI00211B8709|nr:LysM peptidoglycan-binding domain-containing protein [Brevibacterium sp. 68QC2CO]MCQ9384454.1 LysM peptidoglycan-binding domain-containing protein [Brevibacterium sp. 68QC2CO]